MSIEYVTILVYFLFLVIIGLGVSKMNTSVSDYVNGGARGTWWMVGASMFMGGISAFTFTGNASAAFSAGPTFLIIYVANTLGFLLCMIIGPWFRQTRGETWADVLRGRFGVPVEQFSAIIAVFLGPVSAGVQLYALAVFASSILGMPVLWLVFILGAIAVTYSTTGGRWAVMATDFVQGLLMIGMTVLVFFLSLRAIGGWEEFFAHFNQPEFVEDFKFVKDAGQFGQDKYTIKWIVVIFLLQISGYVNLTTAGRFLSVKDGGEARRASLFAAILMFLGSIVWFVPPMVARFLYANEVYGLDVKEPATASYAVIAQHLLPNGLMGLMLAAMFAATMSSLDTSLNGTTGVIVKNIIPWLRGVFKLPPLKDAVGIRWCQFATLLLGFAIIGVACLFARQVKFELFDAFLMISAVIGIPLGLPVLIGLWVRRIYWVTYFVIIACAMLPSIYFVFSSSAGDGWFIQDRMIVIYGFGVIGLFLSLLLWRFANKAERDRIDSFFLKMHTPVDFEKEVGHANDHVQLKMIGTSALLMAGLIALFLFVPNTFGARLQILALVLFMGCMGAAFCWGASRSKLKGRTTS